MSASVGEHTLSIYLGGYAATGYLTAVSTDPTVPTYGQMIGGTGNWSDLATLTFAVAAPGETLTITYTKLGNGSGDASGSVDLDAAWLSSASVGPTVTLNPSNVTMYAGTSEEATFTAAATGTPTPTVQWQEMGDIPATWTDIPGATSDTLTVPVNGTDDDEMYRAVFTNSVSSVDSSAAQLVEMGSPGSIAGSVATAASSYNLTSLGVIDWRTRAPAEMPAALSTMPPGDR